MDFFESLQIIWRRWYVVVPVLVLTLVAIVVVRGRIDPDYQAVSSVTLVGPVQPAGGDPALGTNPLLNTSSSLAATAQATGLAISGPESRATIGNGHLYSDYEVISDPRSPILQVQSTGLKAGVAVNTVDGVVDLARADLQARQTRLGVPPEQFITVEVLSEPAVTGPNNSAELRTTLVIAALGVALSIAAAFAAEGIAVRRRRNAPRGRGGTRPPGRALSNRALIGADGRTVVPDDGEVAGLLRP